ncbi:Rv3654c family TadE-like protein [Actinoplanes sp. G11-F43]|uniref:Rv3654c family TadE-like protein n=1 Tax=Actinoplanes sp. G11-F43 TaxID=3424130 RepID=UPI003D34658E
MPEDDLERAEGDRGAASVLVLAIGLVLVLLGVAGATVGSARVARHQARNAADFGALAGAAHAIEGQMAACAVAGRYVRANDARMTGCVVTGLEIVVRASVGFPGFPAGAEEAARAGPVGSVAGGVLEEVVR